MTEGEDKTDLKGVAGTDHLGLAPWAGSPTKSGFRGLPLDPTSVLFVSLFLVLFAFFAVLNSNASERPDEANDVMESLRAAFGGKSNSLPSGVEVDTGESQVDDTQLSKARKRIAADLPQAGIEVSGGGDQLEVSIPLNSFFIQNTSRLAPSRELVLKALAVISSETAKEPLRITIEFAGQDSDLEEHRKVAALAATLGKYGLPFSHVSVVGTNMATGQIRLVVRRV